MNLLNIITEPKLFNMIVSILYGLSSIRYLIDEKYLTSFYFFVVMTLTLTINAMIKN